MEREKTICVACNEDGYGPSALAYYVIRSIIEEWQVGLTRGDYPFELKIFLLNKSSYGLNRAYYSDLEQVHPIALDSLIKLQKIRGEVAVTKTLDTLKRYVKAREDYFTLVRPYLEYCDVAIDIGVPAFVWSASELEVRHRMTIFDHSWAKTLRLLCSERWAYLYEFNPSPTDADRRLAEELARSIEKDEKRATDVYLFDRYITPLEFLEHWSRLGLNIKILPGVFGYRQDPQTARKVLNGMLFDLGQMPVADRDKLVLISSGGTPVWVDLLPHLINEFLEGPSREYIPFLSNPRVGGELKNQIKKSTKLRWIDFVKGSTLQAIMPRFDLMVARAGGGTVNDALASNTPLICIEERQVQIMLIEQQCLGLGLIPDMPETRLDLFRDRPSACIDAFFYDRKTDPKLEIKGGAERKVALDILSRL